MEGNAKLSPKSRGISDLQDRIVRLEAYERWREPRRIDLPRIVGSELWHRHKQNWSDVLELLTKSQKLATEIRDIVANTG